MRLKLTALAQRQPAVDVEKGLGEDLVREGRRALRWLTLTAHPRRARSAKRRIAMPGAAAAVYTHLHTIGLKVVETVHIAGDQSGSGRTCCLMPWRGPGKQHMFWAAASTWSVVNVQERCE